MRPILAFFFTAGLLLFAFQVSGQALTTAFSPATVNASIGGTVSLQLKVTNFTNITSLQLPITFNSAVLQFTSISNSTLPGFSAANYNAVSGKVTVSWYPDLAQYPSGFTLADNSSVFTVNFNVVANGTTTVNVANVAPLIEVTRNNNVIQVNYSTGGSNVTGGSGGPGPLTGFHVIANTINIPQGQTVCMPVTVNDFTNVVSAAYAMHWNASVLQYQKTQAYNLPDLSASNFNLYPAGSNTLLMSWFDNTLNGVTRPNGTSIYEVCFKATGAVGSQSMITIDGTGFPPGGGGAEVINTASQNVWKSDSGVADTIFVVTAPPPPNAVTFTADKDTVAVGGTTCVDVRVKNFTDVISMQLGITYDATKIQFLAPLQFGANPLGISSANFNTNIPGEIKFTWFDQNALGVDLPDSTVIFSVCFTAVGAANMQSPFNFTSLPGFAVEIVKEPGGEVIPQLNSGHVYITAFQPPIVNLNATPVSCNGSTNGSISATVVNGSSPSFSWAGPGGYNMTTNNTNITGLAAGIYTVTVTVSGGATATAMDTVTAPLALAMPQVTPTGVSCFGGQDGAIAIQPSGGTSPYTFTWTGPQYSNTTTSTTINNLKAGTYTVTITDSKGCTLISNPAISVGQPSDISIPANQLTVSNVSCFGGTNGSISIGNPTGGTSPYTYKWSNMANTKNISSLAAGMYTVTITDNKSCTKAVPVTVGGPAAALSVSQTGTVTPVSCFGANDGKASVQVAGGTQPWVVSWKLTNGQTIATGFSPSNLVPGTYAPVATDNNGCTVVLSAPIQVGGPITPIDLGAPTVQHLKCAGDKSGCITLTPSGGNGAPFTVTWTNSTQTTLQICNLSGGTYTPTVKDANNCPYTFDPITVNEPTALSIGATDTVITAQNGLQLGAIAIVKVNGGTPPLSYNWSGPSINAANQHNEDQTNLQSGVYSLTVSDANNCQFIAQMEVKNTNVLVNTTVSATPSCNDDGCINFTVPVGAIGPYIVSWPNFQYVSADNEFSICNLKSAFYSPTISDAAGNVFNIPAVQVAQLQQALVGDSRTNPFDDFKNGSIALTPIPSSANLSYLWNNGSDASMLVNLDSGTYVVTITNITSGCTSVNTYHLSRQYQPFACQTPQVTQAHCLNSADGAISITVSGGDGPTYTYHWSGPNGYTAGTNNITGLFPGTYTLTIIDESNVSRTCPAVNIASQSQLAITNVNELSNYNGFQVSGATVCDGKAALVYAGNSGAVNIVWSNGIGGANNVTLCGGQYSVTVTDALGCTSVWVDSLTFPPSIIGSFEITTDYNGYDVSCHGSCDGVAKAFAVGGVAPYKIKWPSGQLDQNIPVGGYSQANQLCAGDYSLTVTDANGVTTVYALTVVEPDLLTLQFADVEPETFSSCDGEIIASAPSGAGTISYVWSSSFGKNGDGPRAENLCAGDVVTYVIEDENGCTASGSHLVPYPADGCLRVRPIITPGQIDGNNDYALITCIESFPNNTFEVYNRWGQLVFQTTGYNNGDRRWEGLTASGQVLPDGEYLFVLKFVDDDGNDQQLKGFINLLR